MRIILLTATLLATSIAGAQEARPVLCRFLSFGGPGKAMTAISLSDKGAETACAMSSAQISPPVTCFAKNNSISFLSKDDRKPLANARIPDGVDKAILVFITTPGKAAASPAWKIMVIADSPKNFPPGGAFIANFYNKDIRFIIGEHKGMLRPGGSHGYAMPEERDTFNMAPVVFEFQTGDKWRIANESSLRFLPDLRFLIFAYVDPVSGRPRINTYQDVPPPAPPAAP